MDYHGITNLTITGGSGNLPWGLKHLYYDMRLTTIGIDRDRNLIIQFPIFIQPYTQQLLVLYQIETVQVPNR